MIAFAFTFPAGRYHATTWGRHANEADVAWPPEPARIMRALIATWWRKADHAAFPRAVLDNLVDALAVEPPLFHLPDAVHSHIRAFMPAPEQRKLIYDAFFRLDRAAEIIVAWPGVVLAPEELALAERLLELIGYLGRAESWVEARVAEHGCGTFNAIPREAAGGAAASSVGEVLQTDLPAVAVPTDVIVPVTPRAWAELRERLMRKLEEGGMTRPARTLAQATLPARLSDALAVDTDQWHRAGWSSPPPLRRLVYDRPPVGPLPPRRPRKPSGRVGQPGRPEVARFVLGGRPQPRVEDALRIAEVARWALMSIGKDDVPVELSGRDDNGPLRDDAAHRHAFYLPEDADGDGLIDHLTVYCRLGFSSDARRRLDKLMRLWIEHGRESEDAGRGRKEWRLALEDIASPAAFAGASRLLRQARIWDSVSPYLKSRFDKRRPNTFDAIVETYSVQIMTEWKRRFPHGPAVRVEPLLDPSRPFRFAAPVGTGRSLRSTLAFSRVRAGRGGPQVDTSGGFFRLVFEAEVEGPIALGWGAHFGLGLFSAATEK